MPGRNFSRQFKLECVRQVATGQKRPAQICREHGLAQNVLLRWRKEYEARGEAAFTEKQPSSREEALEAAEKPSWGVSAASSLWRTRSPVTVWVGLCRAGSTHALRFRHWRRRSAHACRSRGSYIIRTRACSTQAASM